MHNHNKLLSYMDNCIGLKTGYTKAAGRTLVSCAEKNGQRLIAVTLQDGNDWADHQALYEFGFSAYPLRTLAVRGKTFTYLRVENGIGPLLPVTAATALFGLRQRQRKSQRSFAGTRRPVRRLLRERPWAMRCSVLMERKSGVLHCWPDEQCAGGGLRTGTVKGRRLK